MTATIDEILATTAECLFFSKEGEFISRQPQVVPSDVVKGGKIYLLKPRAGVSEGVDQGKIVTTCDIANALVYPHYGCLDAKMRLLTNYMLYYRLNGYKSKALERELCARMAFKPFGVSFAKLVDQKELQTCDLVVIVECILVVLDSLKLNVSEWGSLCSCLIINRFAGSDKFDFTGVFRKDIDGPFNVISEADVWRRRSLAVVQSGDDYSLFVGKSSVGWFVYINPDGSRSMKVSPETGEVDIRELGNVNQATVICIDTRKTMTEVFDSKCSCWRVAEDLVAAFGSSVSDRDLNSVYGVSSYADINELKMQQGVSRAASKGSDDVSVWQALSNVMRKLKSEAMTGLRKRIIIITSGEKVDDKAPIDANKLCSEFIGANIIVDAVLLKGVKAQPWQPVATFCRCTGGGAFLVDTPCSATELVTSDAFVDFTRRQLSYVPTKEIEALRPRVHLSRVNCVAPCPVVPIYKEDAPLFWLSEVNPIPKGTLRSRVLNEMRMCSQFSWMSVFCCDKTRLQEWCVLVESPKKSEKRPDHWDVHIIFPDSYPHAPPVYITRTNSKSGENFDGSPSSGYRLKKYSLPYHPRHHIASVLADIRTRLRPEKSEHHDYNQRNWPYIRPPYASVAVFLLGRTVHGKPDTPTRHDNPDPLASYSQLTWQRADPKDLTEWRKLPVKKTEFNIIHAFTARI